MPTPMDRTEPRHLLKIDLSGGRRFEPGQPFAFGVARRPDGPAITVDRLCLHRDGVPWLPTMGEFHYSRYPQAEWRDELLKMRAGGIDIVATYVFWIHHEEDRGAFDFAGRRDLRRFIELCGELGLPIVLRIGPWAHGEARNGGLPEWLLDLGLKLRSDDPAYLDCVRPFYQAIATQAAGLLWKQGGPVVGVQIENEYWGGPQHLLTLKAMAVEAGLDVPLYTRTGWPSLAAPMPPGHLLPLHGGYAEGFWDRDLTAMPGNYWRDFFFSHQREAGSVGTDHFGLYEVDGDEEALHYPFLTCELGGGMMTSYHRRIRIDPLDVLAMAVVKLGSGSNLPGYYMYHGGTNPDSRSGISLNERQASRHTNYNDLPEKTYDFQAPLGEAGQIRPHYHLLRRLHLFLQDYGSALALMPSVLPDVRPTSRDDADTRRWAMRSDGRRGFLFFSNHQRGLSMPAKEGVQFRLQRDDGEAVTLPSRSVTLPARAVGLWPVGLELAQGLTLAWATAQPVCRLEGCTVLAALPGVPVELAFDGVVWVDGAGTVAEAGLTIVRDLPPAAHHLIRLRGADGAAHSLLILDEPTSLGAYKLTIAGRDRLLLTKAAVLAEEGALRLRVSGPGDRAFAVFPAPEAVEVEGQALEADAAGPLAIYSLPDMLPPAPPVRLERVSAAGRPRAIRLGAAKVAEQPSDADFEAAAVYRLHVPVEASRSLLRIQYVGDVARLYLGERLLTDNFYNGTPFEVGLGRYDVGEGPLILKILPLQKDAPIHLAEWPEFGAGERAQESVGAVELVESRDVRLLFRQ